MKYNGRIIVVVVTLVITLAIRQYRCPLLQLSYLSISFYKFRDITCFLVARKTI